MHNKKNKYIYIYIVMTGGRFLLSLEDRANEASDLESAVERGGLFKIKYRGEAPRAGLLHVQDLVTEYQHT